jgi:ABC-type polysaccharide/polyol phosphate export permease
MADPTEAGPRATLRGMSRTEAAAVLRHARSRPSAMALLRDAIAEVSSRRRLIRYLVQAEMKKRGSDTLLGNIWWILDPVLQMGVYLVFVAIIARRPAPDYPLFIFAAILPWKWFSAVITDASTAVVRQERLIKQIAFPKIVLPIATTTAGVVGFVAGLVPLGALLLFTAVDGGSPTRFQPILLAFWLPVIALVQYTFTLAAAILVSAANVFFRDLGNALGHFLRLWWFLSPGLYSLAWMDDAELVRHYPVIRTLAGLNPFAILFESYRAVVYGTADGGPVAPDGIALVGLFLASVAFIALAAIFFKRVEPNFAKVL